MLERPDELLCTLPNLEGKFQTINISLNFMPYAPNGTLLQAAFDAVDENLKSIEDALLPKKSTC